MQTPNKGFTLFEVMVVLAVLAILLLIAAPAFQDMRDRQRVNAAAEAVYAHLQYARSEAIRQNQNLFLQVTAGADWCLGITHNSAGCNCNTPGSCQFGVGDALEQNLLADGFSNIILSTTLTPIEFNSRRGLIPGLTQEGAIRVSGASGLFAEARFSPLGRIRLCGNFGGRPAC